MTDISPIEGNSNYNEIVNAECPGEIYKVIDVLCTTNNCIIFQCYNKRKLKVVIKDCPLRYPVKPHDYRIEVEILSNRNLKNLPELMSSFTQYGRLLIVVPYAVATLASLTKNTIVGNVTKDYGGHRDLYTYKNTIIRDITQALISIHSHGIIHRDIKPENIFLTGSNAKLGDFSCAWCRDFAKPDGFNFDEPENNKNTIIGSLPYRAPELLFGQNYTELIDIWSWCCCVAEMFIIYDQLFEFDTSNSAAGDQLLSATIFKYLGTPTPEEWPEGGKPYRRLYDTLHKYSPSPIEEILPGAPSYIMEYVAGGLKIPSIDRMNAVQLDGVLDRRRPDFNHEAIAARLRVLRPYDYQ